MMNRELKFRVWDSDKKQYEYFELHNNTVPDRLLCQHKYPVQQFTGEYDKNKKPIYEGDIISSYSAEFINENFEAEIVFIDAGFYAKVNEKDYRGIWSGDDIEVVGNIFQLPMQSRS